MASKKIILSIVSTVLLCIVLVFFLSNFQANEIPVPISIRLPVDNERFIYVNNPLIQGKGTPGDELRIYDNDNIIGSATVEQDGNFYFKPEGLTNGNHKLTVNKSTDEYESSTVTIAVDISDQSKAILKSNNTRILENDHAFYANGVNEFESIIKMMGAPEEVEAHFLTAEKLGIKMIRVINYMMDDMALPNPVTAPLVQAADGGSLTPGQYVYKYTCANLSKDSFNYTTAETLPSPASSTIIIGESKKAVLALNPCAQSYRYLIYRRSSTDPVGSEKYLGFVEAPAGQIATFKDDGGYNPATTWSDPTNSPVLETQVRDASATTTLEPGAYVYKYTYNQQRKPNERDEKFIVSGDHFTAGSVSAQINVASGQAVKITIPMQNFPWISIYRKKATDPEGAEKLISFSRNTTGNVIYVDQGQSGSSAIPTTNTTVNINMPTVNETHNNPRTQWPTSQSKAYMTGFGNWNEDALIAADRVMALAKKHNIRIMFTFLDQHDNNTGGIREIARNCAVPNKSFFTDGCSKTMMNQIITKFVQRKNTVTGTIYKDDPAIFAWELINEPYEINGGQEFANWVNKVGTYVKTLDPNHMLSSGDDGSIWFTHNAENAYNANNFHDFVTKGNITPIDLLTWHGYPESDGFVFNHGSYGEFKPDPIKDATWIEKYGPVYGPINIDKAIGQLRLHAHYAELLNKPVVFGEWGVNWKAATGADWISRISSSIINEKPDVVKGEDVFSGIDYTLTPLDNWITSDQWSADLAKDNTMQYNGHPSLKVTPKSWLDSGSNRQYARKVTSIKFPIKGNHPYWFEFSAYNPNDIGFKVGITAYYKNGIRTELDWKYGVVFQNDTSFHTQNRFSLMLCELTMPDADQIEISLDMVNANETQSAWLGEAHLYELNAPGATKDSTFSTTGWWSLPDPEGLGNATNSEALKIAAINFAKKSMSELSPLAPMPLHMTLSGSSEFIQNGDTVTYTITLSNPNTTESTNAVVTSPLPYNCSQFGGCYILRDSATISGATGTSIFENSKLSWTIPTVPTNDVTLTYQIKMGATPAN